MQGAGLELCLRFTFHVSCAAHFRFNCAAVVLQKVGKVLFFLILFIRLLFRQNEMEQTEFAGWARMGTVSNEQILFLK